LVNKENASGETANKHRKRTDAVAVALQYDADTEFAPKVVAGGRGAIAEQILQIAFAQGVKVREDADLAELLSAIDIDSEIPLEAFAAVAEILTYVYRANGNMPDFITEAIEKQGNDREPEATQNDREPEATP
jgi:flagellar biosynthesis protein